LFLPFFFFLIYLLFISYEASQNYDEPEEKVRSRASTVLSTKRESDNKKNALWSKVKLCFVGSEGSGKTSLVSKIRGEKNRDLPTSGMEEKVWQNDGITYVVQDYSGKQIFHAVYPYFFSKMSIYFLCFKIEEKSSKKPEVDHEEIIYWLRTITLFAKDSPIVLVGTHAEHSSTKEKLMDDLTSRYTYNGSPYKIHSIQLTSSKKGKGISEIRKISTNIVNYYKMNEVKICQSWLDLEFDLNLIVSRGRKYIEWDEYCQLASQHVSTSDIGEVTSFFNIVGVLKYFPNDPNLKNLISKTFFLNFILFTLFFFFSFGFCLVYENNC
jgi:GTPase SAR1 family protein